MILKECFRYNINYLLLAYAHKLYTQKSFKVCENQICMLVLSVENSALWNHGETLTKIY